MKKRKDGRYQKKVVVEKNRKSYIKWVYGKTKAEVERKEEAFKEDVELLSTPIIGKLIDKYEDNFAYQNLSYSTAAHYCVWVRKWCAECNLYDTHIAEIKVRDINHYLQRLSDSGMAGSSMHAVLAAIKSLYSFAAIEYDYAGACPAGHATIPASARPSKKRLPPSKEDIQRIIDAVDEPFGLFAYLMLYSGLRRGEALALKWEDCYDGYIHVRHHIIFKTDGSAVDMPFAKTEAGVRSVPIFEPLRPYLEHSKRKKGYIFNRGGKPLSYSWYLTDWKHYVTDNHIECTPHQLRHAFCTTCYESGVDVKVCAAWMGHANISTTMDVYTALTLEMEKKESEKMVKFYAENMLTS